MASKPKLLEQQFEKRKFSLPYNLFDKDLPKFMPTQSAFFHDWEHRFQAYGGGLGNGKCGKFDLRINTLQGEKQLQHVEAGDVVWTIDENLKLSARRVIQRIDSGILPEWIVRLDNGLSISVTPWHPLLRMQPTVRRIGNGPTKRKDGSRIDRREREVEVAEWVPLSECKVGDRLAVGIDYPEGKSCGVSLDKLFLLGVLIGDGGLTLPPAVSVTIGQQELVDRIDHILAHDSLQLSRCSNQYQYRISQRKMGGKRNWMAQWLKDLGLSGCSSHTKFFPTHFLSAKKSEIAALLSGLFVTDGWVDNNYVGYCSVSESLLDGVQSALLRLGIRSQKCKRTVKYKDGRAAFYLQIADSASILRCAEWLDLMWKQPKLIQLVEKNKAKVPRGRNRRFLAGNVEFVRISSIINTGATVQMYDLEIEGTHNFIANNIVAHNTSAIIGKIFYLSTLFPRNRGYIGRWDGKELVQTTMSEFFNAVPASMFETHNKSMGYIKFKRQYGGSEIYYGDLKEARGLKNINLGFFVVDQAEEIDDERWNLLVSRLRKQTVLYGKNNQPLRRADGSVIVAPTYGIAAFNPEGTASYLYRFFHPDSPERQPGYKLYQATTFDGMNAGFTTREYVDDMLKIFPEQARRRYLDGSWEVFEGRVFPQFTREQHVIPPMRPDPSWTYYVSIDHGLSNPTSIGVWGVTPTGIKIRLYTHYEGGGKPVSYHASRLKALTASLPSKPKLEVLDPACWAKNQSRGDYVFAVVDEYNANGVFPVAGQNDWQAGFNRLNEHLAVDPHLIHPYTGQAGSPRLLICEGGDNEKCITEFMNYKWKKAKGTVMRNQPDEPVDHNDHCLTGDSQIACPDGYHRIKDLVGKTPWVYCYDHDRKKLTVAKAAWVKQTGVKSEVWKLTHDSGILFATPDHLIMRRDGTYTPLKNLKPKDRLMPFYKSMSGDGNFKINILCQTDRVTEHRFVYQEAYGDLIEWNEVHHKDGNHLNNNPDNLEQLTTAQHAARHHGGKMISELQKSMTRETMQRKYGQIKQCARCSKDFYTFNPKNKYCRRLCKDRAVAKVKVDYDWKESQRECLYCHSFYEVKYPHQKYCKPYCKHRGRLDRIAELRAAEFTTNHRVISVEFYGYEDVYDMQVDPHHNFVANGILVHNSIDETRYLLSILPTVMQAEQVEPKRDALQLIRDQQAKWNPLAITPTHGGSWMTV